MLEGAILLLEMLVLQAQYGRVRFEIIILFCG